MWMLNSTKWSLFMSKEKYYLCSVHCSNPPPSHTVVPLNKSIHDFLLASRLPGWAEVIPVESSPWAGWARSCPEGNKMEIPTFSWNRSVTWPLVIPIPPPPPSLYPTNSTQVAIFYYVSFLSSVFFPPFILKHPILLLCVNISIANI